MKLIKEIDLPKPKLDFSKYSELLSNFLADMIIKKDYKTYSEKEENYVSYYHKSYDYYKEISDDIVKQLFNYDENGFNFEINCDVIIRDTVNCVWDRYYVIKEIYTRYELNNVLKNVYLEYKRLYQEELNLWKLENQ